MKYWRRDKGSYNQNLKRKTRKKNENKNTYQTLRKVESNRKKKEKKMTKENVQKMVDHDTRGLALLGLEFLGSHHRAVFSIGQATFSDGVALTYRGITEQR